MKYTVILAVMLFVLSSAGAWSRVNPSLVPLTPQEQNIKAILLDLVRNEDEAILCGQTGRLRGVFLPGAGSAQDALHQAIEREEFLKSWARARRLKITAATVSVRTPHITFLSPNRVQVSGVVSEDYIYHYAGERAHYHFGLGIRHEYALQRHHNVWYIRSDDFTDPLDQDTRIPRAAKPAEGRQAHFPRIPLGPQNDGAAHAVSYADRYCGAAPGCGNHGFYNAAYNSYNGEGGDCTNFISQALKAAGFRETPMWSYDRLTGEGDRAWSNAQGLADFLSESGRATLIARGRYPVITQSTAQFPHGAVGALRPGDLISYVERGRAVHTAIVVGYDPHGVPVVDSHTSDRFHVPWDLGWDQRTRYSLWHVHYPSSEPPGTSPSPANNHRRNS